MEDITGVWVFHGEGGRCSSGVFTDKSKAESWISQHQLSGVLTLYPLDIGIYDWSLENGYFEIKKEEQSKPSFIQQFTSGSQEHYHFENGKLD
ncbi:MULTISPECIES: hypothetical protein [unclassified Spirosoma]|uniref:DUF7710 domain-containing protein n=1 Tax=unclassified Spirosoma TaxID=2621999 RepID=UPI000965B75E|nr:MULTISPECIES: hypothetical protein [unclassified Spirosoma]MBN8822316.1 hypothetical protein [Spirosoma sp.]OJW72384.1 MAG: hypothetical protein BGO59_14680 [Spirosoma sp. 48-14]